MTTGESPEETRRKWNALLTVMNNTCPPSAVVSSPLEATSPCESGDVLALARDLMKQSNAVKASRSKGVEKDKPKWSERHVNSFSYTNSVMQKNTRSYFDRPREAESYGLQDRPRLRTTWQLDTPHHEPVSNTSASLSQKTQLSKSASEPGVEARRVLEDSQPKLVITDTHPGGYGPPALRFSFNNANADAFFGSPDWHGRQFLVQVKNKWNLKKTAFIRVVRDAPECDGASYGCWVDKDPEWPWEKNMIIKLLDWDQRHHVLFAKDNGPYVPNLRDYFERPRRLLW